MQANEINRSDVRKAASLFTLFFTRQYSAVISNTIESAAQILTAAVLLKKYGIYRRKVSGI